jgi:hypothetical protein
MKTAVITRIEVDSIPIQVGELLIDPTDGEVVLVGKDGDRLFLVTLEPGRSGNFLGATRAATGRRTTYSAPFRGTITLKSE